MLEGTRKSGMNGSPNGLEGSRVGAAYIDLVAEQVVRRLTGDDVLAERIAGALERRVIGWVFDTETILLAPGLRQSFTTLRRFGEPG